MKVQYIVLCEFNLSPIDVKNFMFSSFSIKVIEGVLFHGMNEAIQFHPLRKKQITRFRRKMLFTVQDLPDAERGKDARHVEFYILHQPWDCFVFGHGN